MNSEIPMYLVYIVYYLLSPILLISLVWMIFKKRDFVQGTLDFGGKEQKTSDALKQNLKNVNRVQVYLIVALLIMMPLTNFTFSWLSEYNMDRDRIFRGEGSYIDNPVRSQIGPSTDSDHILDQMEEDDYHWEDWVVEGIREEIDFDELTRLPGRLGAYYLRRSATREEHVIITYHYFSPIPITQVYGFEVFSEHEVIFLQEGPDTIIYPMDPADTDPF